jgi:pyrroloquinoline quinone (PQQ) biosynthesis protein C
MPNQRDSLIPSAEQLVEHCERFGLNGHVFFGRVLEQPHLKYIWLVLAQGLEGMSQRVPTYLANLAARVENDDIRTYIVMALNDELGSGDPSRRHLVLYENFFKALEPYRPKELVNPTAPGRALSEAMEGVFMSPNLYEALGASLALEVFGKQLDVFLSEVMRRQPVQMNKKDAEWLPLHVEVETKHASESANMAKLLPRTSAELLSLWSGADKVYRGIKGCLDSLDEMCFGTVTGRGKSAA